MRSATHGHFVRIAGDDTDCLLGNAQNFGDDLGKDGLVPLPAGLVPLALPSRHHVQRPSRTLPAPTGA